MTDLTRRSLVGFVRFTIAMALTLFLPAWTLRFWEAWLYWAVFALCSLAITRYFLAHDPALLERRLKVGPGAEPRKTQKIIQSITALLTFALFIVPGFDHRWGWSRVPARMVIAADVAVALGFLVMFFAFRANTHAAGVITVESDQQVVSSGPYGIVRHPMYAGAMLLFIATPIALGSFWTLPIAIALNAAIAVRLVDEEQYLARELRGYGEYRQTVRSRLIPGVW